MEQSVEEKLKALFELQTLHTQIDKIRQTRGELPMEVADLEDEVAGLETRIQKIKAELDEFEDSIVTRKNMIKEALAATKKYDNQLKDVKNNREYDAISKEVEIQGLEIQVSEKRLKNFLSKFRTKPRSMKKPQLLLLSVKDLELKKAELDTITAETEKDEVSIQAKAEVAEKHIEERLLIAYHRLRRNAKMDLRQLPLSVILVQDVLIRSRHKDNQIFVSVSVLLYVSIAAELLLTKVMLKKQYQQLYKFLKIVFSDQET